MRSCGPIGAARAARRTVSAARGAAGVSWTSRGDPRAKSCSSLGLGNRGGTNARPECSVSAWAVEPRSVTAVTDVSNARLVPRSTRTSRVAYAGFKMLSSSWKTLTVAVFGWRTIGGDTFVNF